MLRIIVLSLSLTLGLNLTAESPKRELRGVWVATVWGLDWPATIGAGADAQKLQKKELVALLDEFQRLNFTTVCFQVRSMGDVMYPSRLEPWSSFLSGKRGVDPGWDPLLFAVDECHKRGLEIYAWVNPFRWSTGTDYNTGPDKLWKKKGWLLKHGKYTVFNPGLEEVRAHVVDICREIVEGYEVDGLVFDDYFYPNRIPADESAPDYKLYKKETPWTTFADWRRSCVHKAIADVKAMIADTRPECKFGISPAGVAGKNDTSARKWGVECCDVKAADWQYDEIYSDPVGLMYQGTVDFISPQLYWPTTHATAPFEPLVDWWSKASCHFGSHLYSSVTLERVGQGDKRGNVLDLGRQIDAHRAASIDGNCGIMIYSSRFLPLVKTMLADRFARRSLAPVTGTAGESLIPAPRHLKFSDGHLRWQRPDDLEHAATRYTVYAIPPEVNEREAMADDGDGIDSRYLIGVTYSPEFYLGRREHGWRYAVCAYSAYASEGAPAWL